MVQNVSERIANELTYQWFRRGVDTGIKDMTLLEETGKEIELPPSTLKDKGLYQCVVTFGEWIIIKSKLLIVKIEGVLFNT